MLPGTPAPRQRVAHRAVATSIELPSDSASRPRAKVVAVTPHTSSTPPSTNACRTARRATAGAVASGSRVSHTRITRIRPASRAASARASSAPAGPPPMTAMRASTAGSASDPYNLSRKASVGCKAIPSPGMMEVPPTSTDRTSKSISGLPVTVTVRPCGSNAVTSPTISRALASALSGARSICASW